MNDNVDCVGAPRHEYRYESGWSPAVVCSCGKWRVTTDYDRNSLLSLRVRWLEHVVDALQTDRAHAPNGS